MPILIGQQGIPRQQGVLTKGDRTGLGELNFCFRLYRVNLRRPGPTSAAMAMAHWTEGTPKKERKEPATGRSQRGKVRVRICGQEKVGNIFFFFI